MADPKLGAFAERLATYRDDPIGFCREVLEMDPHEGQRRWLTNATRAENALTTGNRWGKSEIAAARLIWKCVYRVGWDDAMKAAQAKKHEPYHAINVSLTADQAGLVWRKAYGRLQNAKASWLVRDVKMTPFPTIEFVVPAVLEARSTARDGVHLLGNSYDALNWDEAAFEPKFETVRDNVLRMRLVDRSGTLDYTSTGNGRNAYGRYFLDGLAEKDANLYAQTGPTYENPNIPQERVAANAQRMSDRMRRQNILGEIVDAGGDFFAAEDIAAAQALDPRLNDEYQVISRDDEDIVSRAQLVADGKPWEARFPSHRYVHGWDLADKSDWATGFTLDVMDKPFRLVEFERFHRQGWAHVYMRIRDRHRRFAGSSRSTTVVDSTGLGDVVLEELQDIRAEGFKFTGPSKDEMLTNLQSVLSTRELAIPTIQPLIDELTFYERADTNLITDCVMGLGIAALWAKRKKPMLMPKLV